MISRVSSDSVLRHDAAPRELPLGPSQRPSNEEDAKLWDIAATVCDPEIPVLTLEDLGVLRDAYAGQDETVVVITPTYSGCPAMDTMAGQAHGIRHCPAHRSHERRAQFGTGPLGPVRQMSSLQFAEHAGADPFRVHFVQVPLGLQRLQGTLRLLQGALT